MRGVSTLLGALTILAVFAGARTLFPRDARLALGAAGFVALLPMHVALAASVTNDALADLWMAVGFWLLATLATAAATGDCAGLTRRALRLGLVLGLGAWTKAVCLPLFLAAGLTFFWSRANASHRRRSPCGRARSAWGWGRCWRRAGCCGTRRCTGTRWPSTRSRSC